MNFGDNQIYIIKLLSRKKILPDALLDEAKLKCGMEQLGPVDWLIKYKHINEESVLKPLCDDLILPWIDLENISIAEEVIAKVPVDMALKYHIMPYALEMGTLHIATHCPMDLGMVDHIRAHTHSMSVETGIATPSAIEKAIQQYYTGENNSSSTGRPGQKNDAINLQDSIEQSLIHSLEDDHELTKEDAPVIRLVSHIINEAYRMKASDIHLEPLEKMLRIRYRIDGVLVEIKNHPKQLQPSILSRIKLLAGLKLSERRLPQDGKIKIKIQKKSIDIRVSSLPSVYGESVVMRILDKGDLSVGISALGFLSDTEKIWNDLINLPNGVLLITGPTGSGKTTTLYSCLHVLNIPGRKIITVEDPIEYQLTGINQVQIREDINLSFSSVLRACLRQAPNIIMIGEIRDSETAKIAMNAAFTGHLVFSTLHTNDAPGAITRLIDQGIQPFLVASAVRAVLAQRLVRNICPKCKITYKITDEEFRILGLSEEQRDIHLYQGQGCNACQGTGYKGRSGIFELMQMTPEIQEMVYTKKSSTEIRDLAIQKGMRTLREDAVLKVLNGTTTIQELLRVTKIGES